MEKPSSHKPLILGFEPAVFVTLLVFVLVFTALLPQAWWLIMGAAGLGLGIRWLSLWYDKRPRSDK